VSGYRKSLLVEAVVVLAAIAACVLIGYLEGVFGE
jgi:ABC-type dipeptide/oligopeptide/nickel transport system permease subunit